MMTTLFAVFGFGLGVTGLVILSSVPGDGAGSQLVKGAIFRSLGVSIYLLGPTLVGVVGLIVGRRSTDRREAMVLPTVVGVVGFYVFALIALFVISFGISGGITGGAIGSENDGLDLLIVVQVGLPAGFVGGLSGYISNMLY